MELQILAGFISQPRSLYQQMSWKSWELTVLQPVMGGNSDFDFQKFILVSTAKKALILTHSKTQAVDMCLIWEFPSLSSSFSSNIGPSNIGSYQTMSFPSLLKSAEMTPSHSAFYIL